MCSIPLIINYLCRIFAQAYFFKSLIVFIMNKLRIVFFIILTNPTIFIAQICDYKFVYDTAVERTTAVYVQNFENSVQTRAVVKIPVVVHIVWRTPEENISDAQIQSQLNVLNQDFRKRNIDAKDVPGSFKTVAADCELEFCLAMRDSLGRPTSGIVRKQTTFDNVGTEFSNNRRRVYYNDLGGSQNWQPDLYLNIWVCKMGSIIGFANTPITAAIAKPLEDGIIVDYRVFGTTGTVPANSQNNKGRTATHEIGHYFNLLHIWGNTDTCDDDDLVDDTPKQEQANRGCPSFPKISCGVGSMFMNFMDYTDDACMGLFTNGQKARMLAALTQFRAGLINNAATCETVSTQDIDNQVFIYPNPASDYIHIDWKNKTALSKNITLYDTFGRLVFSKKVENREGVNVLPVGGFLNGVYILRLNFDDKILVRKIIISN